MTLLSFKKNAKNSTITVWKPQNGEIPTKTPKAIESDFLVVLS